MNESKTCQTCGATIPADAPEGICPACAIGRGFDPAADASRMAREEAAFRASQMAEIAAAFPNYELLELLGSGGMGEVYKARQKKLDRTVAIKILPKPFGKSDEFTERFLREAQSLAQLSHPNIVTIHDYGESNGLCYFVMEFIDGVDLRRAIETQKLTPEEALQIVPQVCDALQYAHDRGIVHRDIKPANILLSKDGRVKIADFGLAKIVGKTPDKVTLTSTGDFLGTAEYMAPEQRRAAQAVDHRADIYSLGVVFYEMLTGEIPMGRFDPPSKRVGVDIRLDEVVLRTLERQPERRYQRVSEVKEGVQTIASTANVQGAADCPNDYPKNSPVQNGPAETFVPRFSRLALVGACIAPLFVIGAFLLVWAYSIHFGANIFLWSTHGIFGILFVLIAIFGTTILGAVAISEIQHSHGRICGMPLAVADLLLFPIFILDSAIFVMTNLNGYSFFLSLIVILLVDFLIVRWVWGAANKSGERRSGDGSAVTSSPRVFSPSAK